MQNRRFSNTVAALLYCTLFFSTCVQFAVAEVVHAYRKPNEADLLWLLGDVSTSLPDSADIVQVGFLAPAYSKPMLAPRCEPCKPVRLPTQSVPPAPKVVGSKITSGIAPVEEGVTNIAPLFIDSATPVVQMSNERLPPPSSVPQEPNIAVPPTDTVVERLPMSNCKKWFDAPNILSDNEELTRKLHHKRKNCETVFCVPDMLGSSAGFAEYAVGTGTMQFTLPTMLLTRPNMVEHFNAEVKNRIWADYRHWNNAVSVDRYGVNESRAVEQFSFGLEKKILRRTSIELRVPVISQFASNQGVSDTSTSVELGNVSVALKHVWAQNSRWTLSGGIGTTLPTAEDWLVPDGRLNNNLYYLVHFLGVQWHPNKDTFGHFVVQADLPVENNELVFGSDRLKVEGQQVIRAGIQLGRWFFRSDCNKRVCRLGSFVEIDYAVVTNGTPEYRNGTIYVSDFDSRKSTLTAAVGMPMMFGKLTCTNSVILPISGSDRAFSVGYNFSMMRQF